VVGFSLCSYGCPADFLVSEFKVRGGGLAVVYRSWGSVVNSPSWAALGLLPLEEGLVTRVVQSWTGLAGSLREVDWQLAPEEYLFVALSVLGGSMEDTRLFLVGRSGSDEWDEWLAGVVSLVTGGQVEVSLLQEDEKNLRSHVDLQAVLSSISVPQRIVVVYLGDYRRHDSVYELLNVLQRYRERNGSGYLFVLTRSEHPLPEYGPGWWDAMNRYLLSPVNHPAKNMERFLQERGDVVKHYSVHIRTNSTNVQPFGIWMVNVPFGVAGEVGEEGVTVSSPDTGEDDVDEKPEVEKRMRRRSGRKKVDKAVAAEEETSSEVLEEPSHFDESFQSIENGGEEEAVVEDYGSEDDKSEEASEDVLEDVSEDVSEDVADVVDDGEIDLSFLEQMGFRRQESE